MERNSIPFVICVKEWIWGKGNYTLFRKIEEWMAYRDFKSLAANIQNELEDAVTMRIRALFI